MSCLPKGRKIGNSSIDNERNVQDANGNWIGKADYNGTVWDDGFEKEPSMVDGLLILI